MLTGAAVKSEGVTVCTKRPNLELIVIRSEVRAKTYL